MAHRCHSFAWLVSRGISSLCSELSCKGDTQSLKINIAIRKAEYRFVYCLQHSQGSHGNRGQGSWCKFETHAPCAMRNKAIVWSGTSCLLPAFTKLCQAYLFACKYEKISDHSQFLTAWTDFIQQSNHEVSRLNLIVISLRVALNWLDVDGFSWVYAFDNKAVEKTCLLKQEWSSWKGEDSSIFTLETRVGSQLDVQWRAWFQVYVELKKIKGQL